VYAWVGSLKNKKWKVKQSNPDGREAQRLSY
jgi:hypothetical protein